MLTRLNGPVFALNPDLVERADCTPDTVITLVDGTKYLVAESLPELVALIAGARADFVAHRVSTRVNSVRNDGPDLLDEVPPGDPAAG